MVPSPYSLTYGRARVWRTLSAFGAMVGVRHTMVFHDNPHAPSVRLFPTFIPSVVFLLLTFFDLLDRLVLPPIVELVPSNLLPLFLSAPLWLTFAFSPGSGVRGEVLIGNPTLGRLADDALILCTSVSWICVVPPFPSVQSLNSLLPPWLRFFAAVEDPDFRRPCLFPFSLLFACCLIICSSRSASVLDPFSCLALSGLRFPLDL